MTLALRLFGAPAVDFDDSSSPLLFYRRGQLLAYLALRRTWVARSELAALLWPGLDSRLAHANLRKALFRMQSMPWADRVEVRADALRLRLHPLVQQQAAVRLGGGDASTATRAAHASYFRLLMAQLRAGVDSGERSAMQRLDENFEDCRRAWAWSIEHG